MACRGRTFRGERLRVLLGPLSSKAGRATRFLKMWAAVGTEIGSNDKASRARPEERVSHRDHRSPTLRNKQNKTHSQ